jgi:hypothetical protein
MVDDNDLCLEAYCKSMDLDHTHESIGPALSAIADKDRYIRRLRGLIFNLWISLRGKPIPAWDVASLSALHEADKEMAFDFFGIDTIIPEKETPNGN